MFVNKGFVDKNTSSSEVNKSLYREGLGGVCGFEGDRKIQRGSMGIKSTDNRVQEQFLLLFGITNRR